MVSPMVARGAGFLVHESIPMEVYLGEALNGGAFGGCQVAHESGRLVAYGPDLFLVDLVNNSKRA